MTIFRNRPLCLGVALFSGAMLLSAIAGPIGKAIGASAVLLLLLASFLFLKARKLRFLPKYIIPFAIVILAIALSLVSTDIPFTKVKSYDDEETHTVKATVTDILSSYDNYSVLALSVQMVDADEVHLKLQMQVYGHCDLKISDTIAASGHILSLNEEDNRASFIASSVYGTFRPNGDITVLEHRNSLRYLAREVQQSIRAFFVDSFDEDTANILSALLIGDKSGLSPALKYRFTRLGLSHLLALSGLHVSILILALTRFLSLLRVPRKVSNYLLLIFIPLYAIITGLSPSIIRAGCMCIVMIISRFSRRENDSLTALAFAALCILLASPGTVCDLGFWLSVMATLGVILSARLQIVFPFLAAHKKLYQLLLESPVITLCATSFTLPITTYFFGNFSLLFLVANLIFPQLFTWYIYLSLASLVIPPLRTLVNTSTSALIWLLNKLAMIPGTLIPVKTVPLIILSVFLFLSIFLLLIWKHKRPYRLSLAALSFLLAFAIVLGAGVILTSADQRFYYCKGESGDYIAAHSNGKTLLAVSNPSRWSTSEDAHIVMNGIRENDIDCLYFASYSPSLVDAITRLSGIYLICQVVIPSPISEQEHLEIAKLSEICDTLMIPIHLIPPHGTYEFEQFTLTAHERSPLTERVDTQYFSFSISAKSASLTYLSRGYSITPLFRASATPDLVIYGSYGENVPGYEHFRYVTAPDTIILGDPDTPILLSSEQTEMLHDTKTIQNVVKYSYPIQ